ncbi:hypothetical protein ACQRIU_001262 [Beauveria bassiana]
MQDTSTAVFSRFAQFVYSGHYDLETSVGKGVKDADGHMRTQRNILVQHAQLWVFAQMYQIETLKCAVQTQLTNKLTIGEMSPVTFCSEFGELVYYVYGASLRTPTRLPKDPKRSFRIRSRNMLKKSMELTEINARIAIYMERGNDKVVFRTHDDLVPQWGAADANHLSPADLPTQPDYDEYRYVSSPRSSPLPAGSPAIDSASLDPAVLSKSFSEFEPPTLDTFSIEGLEHLQLSLAGEMDPFPSTVAMSPSVILEPVAEPGEKRKRPVSLPTSKPAAHKQRRRAKTTSWFD